MILGCLFVLTQTVQSIDQALIIPVLTCEIVAIFFSFSIGKMKGINRLFSLFIIALAIILSNALIVKTIYQEASNASQIALESTKIRETIKGQIEQEKAIIADLTARSRYTLAKDHQKRLDNLLGKIEMRPSFSSSTSSEAVIFQILVRFLVSLALVFCVHRVSFLL